MGGGWGGEQGGINEGAGEPSYRGVILTGPGKAGRPCYIEHATL